MTTPSLSIFSAEERGLLSDSANAVLTAYLDTLGTGAGTYNMAGAAAKYFIKPSAGLIYVIDTIRITIGTASLATCDGFGGIAGLTNGCLLEIRSGTPVVTTRSLTGGIPIKNNMHLATVGKDTILNCTAHSLVSTDIRNPRSPIRLTGDYGDALYFETRDNLAGLLAMYVFVTGTVFKN